MEMNTKRAIGIDYIGVPCNIDECCKLYNSGDSSGYEIEVSKIPPEITHIRIMEQLHHRNIVDLILKAKDYYHE